MIDGPYKNIIPEKIKLPESNEDMESIVNDIKNLKSEIENDIAEIGGEDEMGDIINEDKELLQEFENRKNKIKHYAFAALNAAFASGFGNTALKHAGGENVGEIMKSLSNPNSFVSLVAAFGMIAQLILVYKIKLKEHSNALNKNQIDQI